MKLDPYYISIYHNRSKTYSEKGDYDHVIYDEAPTVVNQVFRFAPELKKIQESGQAVLNFHKERKEATQ